MYRVSVHTATSSQGAPSRLTWDRVRGHGPAAYRPLPGQDKIGLAFGVDLDVANFAGGLERPAVAPRSPTQPSRVSFDG